MGRKIITIITSYVIRLTVSKNWGENNIEALEISNKLKIYQDDRTDTNFAAPLRMHF